MPVLDPRTIERVAELICDLGGPYQRSTRQLRSFLAAAGWHVEYDGSGRVPWLVETITQRNHDHEAIDSLLRRIIDPREYDSGMASAVKFVELLNNVLAADGIVVELVGQRPTVRHFDEKGSIVPLDGVAARLASEELRDQVRILVWDTAMADILNSRLDEVEACRRVGAYLLAVIGTGAFIEGLLYDVLRPRDPETRKRTESSLQFLLERAHARGWIHHDALTFGNVVREYRNLVHPRQQLALRTFPDEDTLLMCWQPALAVINDLTRLLPPIAHTAPRPS